jgi:hypothetical protein
MAREAEIREQIRIKNFWATYLFFMYALHYLLGVTAVVLSAIVAVKPGFVGKNVDLQQWLAVCLTGITSVIAFISPERVGDRYQRAFRILSVEITRFLSDDSYTLDHVLKAYEAGEDIIHSKQNS